MIHKFENVMLKNKIVIVTGAARGIGKQIALTLAREGANVSLKAGVICFTKSLAFQRRAYGLKAQEYLKLKVLTCMIPELKTT